MKRFRTLTRIAAVAVVSTIMLSACEDDETTAPPTDQEFVAAQADFANYTTWTQTTTPQKGPDPSGFLGGAHNSADTSFTRHIYVNNASATRGSDGEYPNGTVFLKTMSDANGTVQAITAMAKRGANYSPNNNDWEWFFIDPASGAISQRGDTLLGGACASCHFTKADQDYIFTR
jgi:hypothetical protein